MWPLPWHGKLNISLPQDRLTLVTWRLQGRASVEAPLPKAFLPSISQADMLQARRGSPVCAPQSGPIPGILALPATRNVASGPGPRSILDRTTPAFENLKQVPEAACARAFSSIKSLSLWVGTVGHPRSSCRQTTGEKGVLPCHYFL